MADPIRSVIDRQLRDCRKQLAHLRLEIDQADTKGFLKFQEADFMPQPELPIMPRMLSGEELRLTRMRFDNLLEPVQ